MDSRITEKKKQEVVSDDHPFLQAAKRGDIDRLKQLAQRSDLNTQVVNAFGDNALHLALRYSNSVETISYLVNELQAEKKFDIDAKGEEGRIALHYAAEKGYLTVLKKLRELGADLLRVDVGDDNALHLALQYSNSVETISYLVNELQAEKNFAVDAKGLNGETALHRAAVKGYLPVLKKLRELGADLFAVDNDGNNALHLALQYSNSVETISYLVNVLQAEKKFDIDAKGKEGKTALHCAAAKGYLPVLKKLRELGADLLAVDNDGNNVLHLAARSSASVDTITYLVNELQAEKKLAIDARSGYGETALHCAAGRGYLPVLKRLCELGADLLAENDGGDNALHVALRYSDSVETVSYLVNELQAEKNFAVDSKGWDGKTALHCAAAKGYLPVLKKLRELGADLLAEDDGEDNALHLALRESNSVETISYLVDVLQAEKNFAIDAKRCDGQTVLHCAAAKGYLPVLKKLRELGADLLAVDIYGNNVLHLAARSSASVDTITYLVNELQAEKKLAIDARNRYGQTALHCAAVKGYLPVLKKLRELGTDLLAVDNDGNNVLHLAARSSASVDTTTYLVNELQAEKKLAIDARNGYGRTALHCAAAKCYLPVLKKLRELGADLLAVDNDGNNVLHLAAQYSEILAAQYSESVETVKFLLELGVDKVAKNRSGETPEALAVNEGELEIAKLIANYHTQDDNLSSDEASAALALDFSSDSSLELDFPLDLSDDEKLFDIDNMLSATKTDITPTDIESNSKPLSFPTKIPTARVVILLRDLLSQLYPEEENNTEEENAYRDQWNTYLNGLSHQRLQISEIEQLEQQYQELSKRLQHHQHTSDMLKSFDPSEQQHDLAPIEQKQMLPELAEILIEKMDNTDSETTKDKIIQTMADEYKKTVEMELDVSEKKADLSSSLDRIETDLVALKQFVDQESTQYHNQIGSLKEELKEDSSRKQALIDKLKKLEEQHTTLWMEYEAREKVAKEQREIVKQPKLNQYYQIMQKLLNSFFLSSMAVAHGESKIESSKQSVACKVAGGALFFLPGANLLGQFFSHLVDKKRKKKAKMVSKLTVSFAQIDYTSELLSRRLTQRYQKQILHVAHKDIKTLAKCGVARIKKYTQSKDKIDSKKDLIGQLLLAVATVKMKQGKVGQKRIKTVGILDKYNNWNEAGVYQKTGIRVEKIDPKTGGKLMIFYADDNGKRTHTEKYGYRNGTEIEVKQCRYKQMKNNQVKQLPKLMTAKKKQTLFLQQRKISTNHEVEYLKQVVRKEMTHRIQLQKDLQKMQAVLKEQGDTLKQVIVQNRELQRVINRLDTGRSIKPKSLHRFA